MTTENLPAEIPVCQLDHSGYFIGMTVADLSREDGTYLIPGGCVNTSPPTVPAGQRARWVAGAWLLETVSAPPEETPAPKTTEEWRETASISPRQIRQALTRMGLRSSVEAAVAAGDQDLKDWWEFATSFERNHPMVLDMGYHLNITETQLDELWQIGLTL